MLLIKVRIRHVFRKKNTFGLMLVTRNVIIIAV